MRYIVVPKDIVVVSRKDGKPVPGMPPQSFKSTAFDIWLNDGRAVEEGIVAQRRWMKVLDAFEGAKEGDVIALEDQDWELLKKIASKPVATYGAVVMCQLMDHTEAVLGASDKVPAIPNQTEGTPLGEN